MDAAQKYRLYVQNLSVRTKSERKRSIEISNSE